MSRGVRRRRPAPGHIFPGHHRRAVVSAVLVNGRLAVRKTYHDANDRCLERERFARRVLSARFHEVPPLIESGRDYVVSPFYDDTLRYSRRGLRLFPLRRAKEAAAFLAGLYDAGYALLDSHPENMVVDRREGLKFIDFEFLQPYGSRKPSSFEESWDMVGVPPDFAGDQPSSGATSWRRHWEMYVGLTLRELQHDPAGIQHLKRARHWLTRFAPRWAKRRAPEILRESKAVRGRRQGSGSSMSRRC